MNALFEAGLEIEAFLRREGWGFCIIGGLAVARWGQPRATQDVDVSLLTGFGSEAGYVDTVLKSFAARIEDARAFALEARVLLVQASNNVPLDIVLAAFAYEEEVVARASSFQFAPGVSLTTASAEDLVVLKAFAARDRDWSDIDGIVVRQADRLDWDYITQRLKPLLELKGDGGSMERLARIRDRR